MEDFLDQTPEEYAPPPPVPFRREKPATRELPASEEAEQHVLACCLIDPAVLDHCVNERVSDTSFFWPANQTIFMALRELHERKVPLDIQVLAEELASRKLFDQVGGFPYLMQITGGVPTTAHAKYFIEKVREKHTLRELIRRSTSVIEQCYGFTGGMEDFMQYVEKEILFQSRSRGKGRNWKSAVAEARRQLNVMMTTAPGVSASGEISWGFYDLDRVFGPLQKGQLVILAARPSIGKSSLMRQIVRKALSNNEACFIATLEVKDYAIARHMAQTDSRVSYSSLKRTRSAADAVSFDSALSEIEGLPLHTLDDFAATSGQICAEARLLHDKHPLSLIVVDHLQELPDGHGGRNQTTTEALGTIAKKLKALAGELDVPVLVLSQLNRSMERENRAPRLDDLRASGDIEQAADKVVFLHRPSHHPITNAPQPISAEASELPTFYVQVEQAKGRDDGTARLGLTFQRDIASFYTFQP